MCLFYGVVKKTVEMGNKIIVCPNDPKYGPNDPRCRKYQARLERRRARIEAMQTKLQKKREAIEQRVAAGPVSPIKSVKAVQVQAVAVSRPMIPSLVN